MTFGLGFVQWFLLAWYGELVLFITGVLQEQKSAQHFCEREVESGFWRCLDAEMPVG